MGITPPTLDSHFGAEKGQGLGWPNRGYLELNAMVTYESKWSLDPGEAYISQSVPDFAKLSMYSPPVQHVVRCLIDATTKGRTFVR